MSGSLADAQRAMARYLRDPQGQHAPEGIEARRLLVYRDLVYRNIEGFVRSGFPVLHSLYEPAAWEARVRDFIQHHRCHTPLFLRISEEFIDYLAALPAGDLRPFEAELAHYEWLELAVEVADGDPAVTVDGLTPDRACARLAETARVASYRYPVHRIGPSFQPAESGEASHLLVYRARTGRAKFVELNGATARLLHEIGAAAGSRVAATLAQLAQEWSMAPEALQAHGWQQLLELNALGAVRLEEG